MMDLGLLSLVKWACGNTAGILVKLSMVVLRSWFESRVWSWLETESWVDSWIESWIWSWMGLKSWVMVESWMESSLNGTSWCCEESYECMDEVSSGMELRWVDMTSGSRASGRMEDVMVEESWWSWAEMSVWKGSDESSRVKPNSSGGVIGSS